MRTTVVLLCAAAAVALAGCERCSDGDGLVASKETAGSEDLPWERMELGSGVEAFRSALAGLAGLAPEEAEAVITCVDQSAIEVVDPARGIASERSSGDGSLSNCALLQAGARKSWRLVSAKGEFLAGALVRATFDFPPDGHGEILAEMTGRFGPGEERELESRSLLGTGRRAVRLWKVKGSLWILESGERTARLVHQDTERLARLPEPAPAAERGVPVSLDDIGLGGGLDLDDEGLDDIPLVQPADAGPGR
jgi:hypothetical protein